MSKFKVGQVVRLNSGGSDMTIDRIYEEQEDQIETLNLVWMDDEGNLCEHELASICVFSKE